MVGPFSAWSVLEQSLNSVGEAQNPSLLRPRKRRPDLDESFQSETRGVASFKDRTLDVWREGREPGCFPDPATVDSCDWRSCSLDVQS
jgi:hypothetical protein